MARSHRRKDVLAAMLIIGSALVYWMSRRTPEITFDDRDAPAARGPRSVDPKASNLPGLNRAE